MPAPALQACPPSSCAAREQASKICGCAHRMHLPAPAAASAWPQLAQLLLQPAPPCPSDMIPTGGPVGRCFNAVTVPGCRQMSLKAGGSLAVALATTCPSGAAATAAPAWLLCCWAGAKAHSCVAAAAASSGPSAGPLLPPHASSPYLSLACRSAALHWAAQQHLLPILPDPGPRGPARAVRVIRPGLRWQVPGKQPSPGDLRMVCLLLCMQLAMLVADLRPVQHMRTAAARGCTRCCPLQGLPTSFLPCADMVRISAGRNGTCLNSITSGGQRVPFRRGDLRYAAAFASTC